jgi:hypothetical protein
VHLFFGLIFLPRTCLPAKAGTVSRFYLKEVGVLFCSSFVGQVRKTIEQKTL